MPVAPEPHIVVAEGARQLLGASQQIHGRGLGVRRQLSSAGDDLVPAGAEGIRVHRQEDDMERAATGLHQHLPTCQHSAEQAEPLLIGEQLNAARNLGEAGLDLGVHAVGELSPLDFRPSDGERLGGVQHQVGDMQLGQQPHQRGCLAFRHADGLAIFIEPEQAGVGDVPDVIWDKHEEDVIEVAVELLIVQEGLAGAVAVHAEVEHVEALSAAGVQQVVQDLSEHVLRRQHRVLNEGITEEPDIH